VVPYLAPAAGYGDVTFALYASWLAYDVLRDLLSPDRAKTHALDARVGVLYTLVTSAGAGAPRGLWTLQPEITPRAYLPLHLLASFRNRLGFDWAVDGGSGFSFRYRGRFQVEREFEAGPSSITPFVNVEFFWQTPPAGWTQFRLQGGLQYGFQAFARGQAIELNFTGITSLPRRTWTPQIGIILSSYF
jgi:hypothetical protein